MSDVKNLVQYCKSTIDLDWSPMTMSFVDFEVFAKKLFGQLFESVTITSSVLIDGMCIELFKLLGDKSVVFIIQKDIPHEDLELEFEQWEFYPFGEYKESTLYGTGCVKSFGELLDLLVWLLT